MIGLREAVYQQAQTEFKTTAVGTFISGQEGVRLAVTNFDESTGRPLMLYEEFAG